MTTQLSGSRLPIARHCGYSFRADNNLPKFRLDQDNADAAAGTNKHAFLLAYAETGKFPPMTASEKILAGHFRDWWGIRRAKTEQAFMLTAKEGKARSLGDHIGRKYGDVAPGEIPLTVDYWYQFPKGNDGALVCVGDIKTGFAAHVEAPEFNLQLLAGGLAAGMFASESPEPFSALLEIPNVTEEGVYCRDYIATPQALLLALNEIIAIQDRIPGSEPVVGEHCRWCDIKGCCPKQAEVAARILEQRNGRKMLATWSTEFVSDDNERLLVEELSAIKKAIEAVEEAMKKRAGVRPIDMGDGTVYRAVVCRKSATDKKLVEAILGDRLAECTKIIEYEQFRRVKA